MRWLPQSLLWRTLVILVAALVLSQAAAVWLLDQYVTRPRVAVGMRQFVSHLKTVAAALLTAFRDLIVPGVAHLDVRTDEVVAWLDAGAPT